MCGWSLSSSIDSSNSIAMAFRIHLISTTGERLGIEVKGLSLHDFFDVSDDEIWFFTVNGATSFF